MSQTSVLRCLETSHWRPRQDSNLRHRLRRPVLYPLSYGGGRMREQADDRSRRAGGRRPASPGVGVLPYPAPPCRSTTTSPPRRWSAICCRGRPSVDERGPPPRRRRRPARAGRGVRHAAVRLRRGAPARTPAGRRWPPGATAWPTPPRPSCAGPWPGWPTRRGCTSTWRPGASCTWRCPPGSRPERLVLHGNNKSAEELAAALEPASAGSSSTPSTRSPASAACSSRGRRRAARPKVLVRVTPGVEAHTHEFVRTGQEDSKFGFSVASGAAAEAVAALELHARASSWSASTPTSAARSSTRPPSSRRPRCSARSSPRSACPSSWSAAGSACPTSTASAPRPRPSGPRPPGSACAAAGVDPATRITAEPGRSIVATAGITLYTVGTVKHLPGIRTYVSVDGGMSDNPRPVLYGSGYEAFLPRAVGRAPAPAGAGGGQALRERRPRRARRLRARRPRGGRRPGHAGHRRLRLLHGLQLQQGAAARPWSSWPTARPGWWSAARPSRTCSASTPDAADVRSSRAGPAAEGPSHLVPLGA